MQQRPAILHTSVRYEEGSRNGLSYVHDRHPFLGFLYLLDAAEPLSHVFLAVLYLTDFLVLDQLCHYVNPQYGGLHISIILGPAHYDVETVERFIGDDEACREAVARLHMKQFGRDEGSRSASYCNSKAMMSSAGAMTGSYNYTVAARTRHYEHCTIIGADERDRTALSEELKLLWNRILTDEIKFPKKATGKRSVSQSITDPYSKRE